MLNDYYVRIKDFQEKIISYATNILKVYDNELQLRLEDYNLLKNKKNCLETSTAIGYVLEEFIVSKLEIYTRNHVSPDYVIRRCESSAAALSYDCLASIGDIQALINIKVDKGGNNAVASIKNLFKNYVMDNPETVKAFLVLKFHYSFNNSKYDNERKIFIDRVDSFFLEEIDFPLDSYKKDNRNWTKSFDENSGRLQVSSSYLNKHRLGSDFVSYENTKKLIENIYLSNLSKEK